MPRPALEHEKVHRPGTLTGMITSCHDLLKTDLYLFEAISPTPTQRLPQERDHPDPSNLRPRSTLPLPKAPHITPIPESPRVEWSAHSMCGSRTVKHITHPTSPSTPIPQDQNAPSARTAPAQFFHAGFTPRLLSIWNPPRLFLLRTAHSQKIYRPPSHGITSHSHPPAAAGSAP